VVSCQDERADNLRPLVPVTRPPAAAMMLAGAGGRPARKGAVHCEPERVRGARARALYRGAPTGGQPRPAGCRRAGCITAGGHAGRPRAGTGRGVRGRRRGGWPAAGHRRGPHDPLRAGRHRDSGRRLEPGRRPPARRDELPHRAGDAGGIDVADRPARPDRQLRRCSRFHRCPDPPARHRVVGRLSHQGGGAAVGRDGRELQAARAAARRYRGPDRRLHRAGGHCHRQHAGPGGAGRLEGADRQGCGRDQAADRARPARRDPAAAGVAGA
jgi:hypothetical protein